MAEYLVDVERYFHGPLDLLLHLVREKEIEVDKISLAKVADDYARHVESLLDLDVNAVGEYLVIAATLMLIKSRYLMPREVVDVEEDLGPDDELILQLIEYKRFRETAEDLLNRERERDGLFERGRFDDVETRVEERELAELSPWDLLSAFTRVLREQARFKPHEIGQREKSLREYVLDLLGSLRDRGGRASFHELVLKPDITRIDFVGSFFAILECCRQGMLRAVQADDFGSIDLELTDADYEKQLERVLFALEVNPGLEAKGGPAQDAGPAPDEPAASAEPSPAAELPLESPAADPPAAAPAAAELAEP
jgi:segregation and condensation protein A